MPEVRLPGRLLQGREGASLKARPRERPAPPAGARLARSLAHADHLKLMLPLGFAVSQMSLAAIIFT